MNLSLWLARQAQIAPKDPALFLGRDCVADYGTFWRQARGVAGWLVAQGVKPGDRVAIFMKNVPEYLILFYGVWAAGAAVVPINAKLHPEEVMYVLKDSGALILFASSDLVTGVLQNQSSCDVQIADAPAFRTFCAHHPLPEIRERSADDLAWLFYTSGTTGKPKGVIISHGMISLVSLCYNTDVEPVSKDDAAIYAAPMSHGAGLYNAMHVQAGARHVCPVSAGFDPREIFDLAAHFDHAHLFAAPTMVRRLTDAAQSDDVPGVGLRTVVYAGGPMYNADIIEAVDVFGPKFVQIYGQGECPMGITVLSRSDVADRAHPRWAARLQSVGRAQSAVEVAIGGPDGAILPVATHGEIMVRGETVMPGYWNNPEATAQTLRNGWLMTGDIGYMDVDGYVTLQDRSKDMIISGGSNIYPREVEEVLLTAQGVREVSVVGRPHPDWGEEVVAFVVGRFEPDQLDRMCLDHIARYKRPRAYIEIDALPKNNYGKVLKTELRKKFSGI